MGAGVRRLDHSPSPIALSQLPPAQVQLIKSDPGLSNLVGKDQVIRDVPALFQRLDALDHAQPRGASSPSRAQEMRDALAPSGSYAAQLDTSASPLRARQGIFAQPVSTEARLGAMSNQELLALSEGPGGKEKLAAMEIELKKGPLTPAKQKQLDRIHAATFTPGPGIQLNGNAADKASWLHMTREAMLESPSFAKLMNEASKDAAHPVKVNLQRNGDAMLDSFSLQTLDVGDLEKLPARPETSRPELMTRGEVLAHQMREQREKALHKADYHPAHAAAIEQQNAYRRDIGQQSMRLMPPNDSTRVPPDEHGAIITLHYDDNSHQALLFNKDRNLSGTAYYQDEPTKKSATP